MTLQFRSYVGPLQTSHDSTATWTSVLDGFTGSEPAAMPRMIAVWTKRARSTRAGGRDDSIVDHAHDVASQRSLTASGLLRPYLGLAPGGEVCET
jgi:hypothetical protein